MRPIESGSLPKIILHDLTKACEKLMPKSILDVTLKSKSTTTDPTKIGDLILIFIKIKYAKRSVHVLRKLFNRLRVARKSFLDASIYIDGD